MTEADILREQAEHAEAHGQEKAEKLHEAADAQEKADTAKKEAVSANDKQGSTNSFL